MYTLSFNSAFVLLKPEKYCLYALMQKNTIHTVNLSQNYSLLEISYKTSELMCYLQNLNVLFASKPFKYMFYFSIQSSTEMKQH